VLDTELGELMTGTAAVSIEGAKGVGKTVTASRRAATVIRLDDPAEREAFAANPERLTSVAPPVLLDDWQRLPAVWDLVRRAVDADRRPGRFLLTGSAAPLGTALHSGAGRIVTARMRPMTLAERGVGEATVSLRELLTGDRKAVDGDSTVTVPQYVEELLASGFPGLRNVSGRALRAELDSYLDRIVHKDFPELGQRVRNPSALRRWMRAYAAATSTTASYEVIRDAATGGDADKPARSTTIPYRDALESLWIVDPVPAWLPAGSPVRRLASAPKHQLADPALAARLLGVDADALLSGRGNPPPGGRNRTMLGALFESLVTLCIRVYAQAAEGRVGHLRTRAGEHEIDLIVERADGRVVALEVKLAREVGDVDVKHLRWLGRQIGSDLLDAVVVTSGPYAYRRADGIAVVPAALLGP
jgi:predicted AAA+ superfamily ATPase